MRTPFSDIFREWAERIPTLIRRILANPLVRVKSTWYWLVSHDPFSVLTAWLIPHRAILGWIAVVAFIALLWLDARTTVITLWGIIGAGLVVSMILTEHGERIQRSAWLRRNVGTVNDFVVSIIAATGFAQLLAVGVSGETANQLRFGESRAVRRAAAAEAREVIRRFRASPPLPLNKIPLNAKGLDRSHRMVSRLIEANSSLIDRMTELHGALQQWEAMMVMTSGTLPDPDAALTEGLLGIGGIRDDDDAAARSQRRALFSNLATATADVCERCSDLQNEAGTIPSD